MIIHQIHNSYPMQRRSFSAAGVPYVYGKLAKESRLTKPCLPAHADETGGASRRSLMVTRV